MEFQCIKLTALVCLSTIFIFAFKFQNTEAFVHYGPSIELLTRQSETHGSAYYRKLKGETVYLSDYDPVFSVLVPLVPDKAFVNKTEALSYFKDFHHGEFYVQAPKDYGVVAAIQILRLFTVTGNQSKCLDYIRFKEVKANEIPVDEPTPNLESESHPKICGKVDQDDLNLRPKDLLGPRNFVATSGKMAIELVMVSQSLSMKWEIENKYKYKNTLEIVTAAEISFTAFPLKAKLIKVPKLPSVFNDTNSSLPDFTVAPSTGSANSADQINFILCTLPEPEPGDLSREQAVEINQNNSEENDDVNNITSASTKALRPCYNNEAEGALYCIHKELFCDEIIQCGFQSHFAQDELSCSSSNDRNDLIKLESIFQTLQNLNSNSGSGSDSSSSSLFNGTRFNPMVVTNDKPVEVKIIQYFIIVVSCAAGLASIVGIIWWLRRSHSNFCKASSDADDAVAEIYWSGIQPTPSDKYIADRSLAAIKIENLLEDHKQQQFGKNSSNDKSNVQASVV